MDSNLNKIKNAQLDLLDELDRLCKKHGIRYFLMGGTLIGAIRHNGFIPWDDDIDVGMERKEYEKFRAVCRTDLREEFELLDWDIDPQSPHPFSKICIRGTKYHERIASGSGAVSEIFIDVFPYDNVPEDPKVQRCLRLESLVVRKMILLKSHYNIYGRRIGVNAIYLGLQFLSLFIRMDRLKQIYSRMMTRYDDRDTKYVINYGGSYDFSTELIERAWITDLTTHIFEDNYYSIPVRYNEYLTHVYGDYMQLPPEETREGRHHVDIIDFGNYHSSRD